MKNVSAIILCGTPDDSTYAVVLVSTKDLDIANKALAEAHTQYWDENNPYWYCWGWGDFIEDELIKSDIVHSIIYIEDFEALLNKNESNGITDYADYLYSKYLEYVEKNVDKIITRY